MDFGALWRVLARLLHNYFTVNGPDLALSLGSSLCSGASLRGVGLSSDAGSIPAASTISSVSGSDSSITEVVQNRYNSLNDNKLASGVASKNKTLPQHFSNTSDTSKCVPGVPESSSVGWRLPPGLPATIIDGLKDWHNLPENIRKAVELLISGEKVE